MEQVSNLTWHIKMGCKIKDISMEDKIINSREENIGEYFCDLMGKKTYYKHPVYNSLVKTW